MAAVHEPLGPAPTQTLTVRRMSALGVTFRREVALMWSGGGALAPLGFFLGATMLVPLAMGPERALLQSAGPPLVWIAAALAVLATLERLFQADLEDGSLDQMLLSRASLEALVLAKGARCGARWACRSRWRRAGGDCVAGAGRAGAVRLC